MLAVAYSSALSYVRSDAVVPLIYLSMDPDPPDEVPNAQTLASAGVENGQQIADMVPPRRAFGGPPDIPTDRVQVLRNAFESVLTQDDEFQADAEASERPITYQNGEETAAAIAGYVNGWEDRQSLLDRIQNA